MMRKDFHLIHADFLPLHHGCMINNEIYKSGFDKPSILI